MNNKPKSLTENHHERAAQSMENFVLYVSSPWRVVWVNFIAGIFRGLGTIIGASIVIAIIIWLLSLFTKVPLVGEYAQDVEDIVSGYVRETNYNDELDRVGDTLERIEATLKQQTQTDTELQE
ncbi:DUF5665 domain-containing protein [Leucothrix pacifica]|uniref:Uncharacterized protein n=1 Tax=Leucothrix pacifica TaxID=1247513 RepID=A0A317CP25_9GAMM|nr:DUF5665 domain-containing protein [Leucothrix pacifica]PWQ99911.1 hypothetical protein DKW60_04390 [Leucothrix pacifica]